MMQIPCGSRRCATCKYWTGARKISGSSVSVDSTESGKCTKSGNSNCGKEKSAMTDCSAWTRV